MRHQSRDESLPSPAVHHSFIALSKNFGYRCEAVWLYPWAKTDDETIDSFHPRCGRTPGVFRRCANCTAGGKVYDRARANSRARLLERAGPLTTSCQGAGAYGIHAKRPIAGGRLPPGRHSTSGSQHTSTRPGFPGRREAVCSGADGRQNLRGQCDIWHG